MSILTGKDILNVLFKLKNPASLNEIVEHLSANKEDNKTALLKDAEVILEAGVRFGFIVEENNQYRTEYMFPDDELRIQPRGADEETNEDELNDYEDNCGPRLSRRRRSRSRSTRRRNSRRRRHG